MELLVWQRPDLYKVPTQNELNAGMIWWVNLLDPQETQLPQFDMGHLHVITGGPYQTSLTNSYVTAIQVIITSPPLPSHRVL